MSESCKVIAPIIVVLVILSCFAFLFRKKLVAFLEPKVIGFIEG